MKTTRELYMQRMAQFEPPIHEIAHNNVVVHRVLEMYARFDIITKEEALSQMVVLLAKDWKQTHDRYVAVMMNTSMIFPTHETPTPKAS